MISSEFVAQQRESQNKALKTLLLQALGGSIAFHAVLLLANVKPLLQPNLAEQEEIVIVTDSLDELEGEQEESPEPDPESNADLLTGSGGGSEGSGSSISESTARSPQAASLKTAASIQNLDPKIDQSGD